jgi:hypothetical protein
MMEIACLPRLVVSAGTGHGKVDELLERAGIDRLNTWLRRMVFDLFADDSSPAANG